MFRVETISYAFTQTCPHFFQCFCRSLSWPRSLLKPLLDLLSWFNRVSPVRPRRSAANRVFEHGSCHADYGAVDIGRRLFDRVDWFFLRGRSVCLTQSHSWACRVNDALSRSRCRSAPVCRPQSASLHQLLPTPVASAAGRCCTILSLRPMTHNSETGQSMTYPENILAIIAVQLFKSVKIPHSYIILKKWRFVLDYSVFRIFTDDFKILLIHKFD